RTTQDGREKHAWKGQIIAELRLAREQGGVLDARHVLTQIAGLTERQLAQISRGSLAHINLCLQCFFADKQTSRDFMHALRNLLGDLPLLGVLSSLSAATSVLP